MFRFARAASPFLGAGFAIHQHTRSHCEDVKKGSDFIYVGTYTEKLPWAPNGDGKGIHTFRINLSNGNLSEVTTTPAGVNPSYQCINSDATRLYSVNEHVANHGSVRAFSIDQSNGHLKPLGPVRSSYGSGPCHLVVKDKSAKPQLYVTNYMTGELAIYPLSQDDQTFGEINEGIGIKPLEGHAKGTVSGGVPERQESPHAHCFVMDEFQTFGYLVDLGCDQVLQFDLTTNQRLSVPFVSIHTGAGPRHIVLHPHCPFVYVVNELDCTITSFRRVLDGQLVPLSLSASKLTKDCPSRSDSNVISTLPGNPKTHDGISSCSAIRIHPSGRFLYAANRFSDTIAIFQLDTIRGGLTSIGHVPTRGKTPRDFVIDHSGSYLFVGNQDTNSIETFSIDPKTGMLNWKSSISCPSPVCLNQIKLN